MRLARTLFLVGAAPLVLGAAAGCHRDTDEDLGLGRKAKDAEAVDPARLTEPGVLERALQHGYELGDQHFGGHRRTQHLDLTLQTSGAVGDQRETLAEDWRTEVDAKGNVHATHDTVRGKDQRAVPLDGGIEWFSVGGRYYVRLAHGRMVERDPQGDEIERQRGQQEAPLAGYLALLGRFASRSDKGEQRVASAGGRAAREIALGLAASPRPLSDDGQPAHEWRRSVKVTAFDGVIDVDAATGMPLRATLDATYSFTQPGTGATVTVTLAYRSASDAVGAVAAITAPENAEPETARVRPLLDRGALLEGLAGPH